MYNAKYNNREAGYIIYITLIIDCQAAMTACGRFTFPLGGMIMKKEIEIVVHRPKPENIEKFEAVLSEELARLIEVLLTKPLQ